MVFVQSKYTGFKKTYVLYTVYVILNCALSDVQLCSSSKYYVILNYALSDVQLCSKCQMMPLNTFYRKEKHAYIIYCISTYILHTYNFYVLPWIHTSLGTQLWLETKFSLKYSTHSF